MKNNDFLVIKLNSKNVFIGKNKEEEIVLIACPGNQESQSFVAVLSELIDVKKV